MIRFTSTRPQPSRPIMHKKTEIKEKEEREGTQNVNVENPIVGKTTAAHRLQKITMREELRDMEAQRQRPLFPLLRHTAVTIEETTSFSLSLSLYTVTLYSHNTTSTTMFNLHNRVALSHIYTHMTFRLFTHIAPGSSQAHIHICVHFGREGYHRVFNHPVIHTSHLEGPLPQQA